MIYHCVTQSLNTNQNVDLNILLTGTDVDGDFLTFEIVSNPANGVLSGILPNVIYTPNSNFTGLDYFRFRVNTEPHGVQIRPRINISSVVAVNNPPTAMPDEYSVLRDHQLVVNDPAFCQMIVMSTAT